MMQYKAPRVAIITPVHNGGNFIRDALESVQSQTYANIIHFVLDNASTDQTSEICESYAQHRISVVVLHNSTLLPLCENWNKAVEIGSAGSDYFRILCADDTMPSDSIAKMVALAESDPRISLVGGEQDTANGVADCGWDKSRSVFAGTEAVRAFLLGTAWFAAPHLLYRTDVTSLRYPFFDESLMAFDTEIAFHILSSGGALGFIHEPVGYTRVHEQSITRTQLLPMHRDYFDWYVLLRRYGAALLTADEHAARLRAFHRHYMGRLLVWRFAHRNLKAHDWHMSNLKALGTEPSLPEFADAVLHFGLRKLGFRPRWNCWPQG